VFLDNCDRVVVDRLLVNDRGAKTAVWIGAAADPGDLGVRVDHLQAELGKGVPAIVDLRNKR
jgi:hypothetical protein